MLHPNYNNTISACRKSKQWRRALEPFTEGENRRDQFFLTDLGWEWARRAKAEHECRSGESLEIEETEGFAVTADAYSHFE